MSTKTAIEDAGKRFATDTAHHEMTVMHDVGLYRHLLFRGATEMKDGSLQPSSFYWFEVVTWPGALVINGDNGNFLFSNGDTDLFPLLRGLADPWYWSQKVRAGQEIRRYSADCFRRTVLDDVEDDDEEEWPGLRVAVETEILARDIYGEHNARELIDDFEFGATLTASCSCGTVHGGISPGDDIRWETGHRAMAPAGSGQHRVTWAQVDGFRFRDTWEWDLSDYTYQFLWCCHAIPWAISVYDKARATVTA